MHLPRFAVSTVDGLLADTDNPRLAATIFAFDVPLHPQNPYSVTTGDGIDGARITWHFQQTSPAGNSPEAIAKAWDDEKLPLSNPVSICRESFRIHKRFTESIKMRIGHSFWHGAAVRITNTRKAAVLSAIGHRLLGWQYNDRVTTWCFHESAAVDATLIDDPELYQKLPDAAISYARGAILGHEFMIHEIKKATQFQVKHKGRTAIIGSNMPKAELDKLEKIFYRK